MAKLDQLPNTFTTGMARDSGLHFRDLYWLRDSGDLLELSRGVFRKADAPAPTHPDLLAVSRRVPSAIVCCVSAAAVHDLTDEIPPAVQIAVPRAQRPPSVDFPHIEVFRFGEARFSDGLSSVEAAPGEFVRLYSPVRTVIDLMRLRGRLGEPLALGALRRYLRRPDADPASLMAMARDFDVFGPVRAAVDVVMAE